MILLSGEAVEDGGWGVDLGVEVTAAVGVIVGVGVTVAVTLIGG